MTDWFRSWHGAPTDNKWLVIGRKAGVSPAIVSAIVWALFDYASQREERGRVDGFDVETYAAFADLDEAQVQAVIDALVDKAIIKDGALAAWEKRQPKREDGAAERAKAWRERNRTQSNAPERPDTEQIQIQIQKDSSEKPVPVSPRDPVLNSDDVFTVYSDPEIDRLQLEFDAENIRQTLPEIWEWSGRKGVEKLNERKALVWKTLQNRRASSELLEAKQHAPPIAVSASLANSRLTQARHR